MAEARTLVVDIGGSSVKCLASGQHEARKFDSDPGLTPAAMVRGVLDLTADWPYDRLTIGYPGVVHDDRVVREPHNLGSGWVGFDFAAAFGKPVRLINDAAMQALGSYRGGTLLFLGLGTGLGSALIVRGHVHALELGHLAWTRKHVYEDFLGKAGFARLGARKWRHKVHQAVKELADALLPDEIVLGGGRAQRMKTLPERTRLGDNAAAFEGGFRLWNDARPPARAARRRAG